MTRAKSRIPSLIAALLISATVFSGNTISAYANQRKTDNLEILKLASKHYVIPVYIDKDDFMKVLTEDILRVSKVYSQYYVDEITLKKDVANARVVSHTIDISNFDIQEVTVNIKIMSDDLLKSQNLVEKVKIKICSETSPKINLSENAITFIQGQSFDPQEYINSVESVIGVNDQTWSIDNPVNSDEPGNYTVTYAVANKFGNVGTAQLDVTVKEKPKPKPKPKPVVKRAVMAANAQVAPADEISYMLSLINQQRAAIGVAPLRLAAGDGMSAASVRAAEIRGYLSHQRPNGGSYKTALDQFGVSRQADAEVLTYSGLGVVSKFNWWMGSGGHRSKLLSPQYNVIALGKNGEYWCGLLYRQ